MSRAWQGWALGLAAVVWGAAVWAVPVNDIRIVPRGPVPISAEQVRGQISARVGQELDRGALSEDLRALQKSSIYSFAEVRLEQAADGGVILTFHVQGRPVIRTLTVSGADYIGNKKVRNLMEIGSGDRADDAVLGEKSQKVREHYRKEYFPDAKVTWTFHPVAGHPDMTDVDIQVTEGRRAVVRKIRFTGNRHIPARELRKVMAQKQSTWLSWMTSAGMYDPGVLVADREVLRKVFMDKGYLGATVGEPQIAYVNRKKIDITFPVHEGPVYTLAAWRIEGMQSFAERDVVRGVVVNTGAVATLEGLTRGAQNIRDYYGSRGYIKTLVDPRITLDTNRAAAAVMYHVQEGPLAYIQNIEIRGNAQTQDKVIRREIGVAPGEVYNDVKIRASENRLRNLNYFSFVNSYPEDTVVSNRFNLVFDLEEQRTGQFMVGAGFSSIDNVLGYVELTQGNFDLFGWPRFTGGGQRLRLRAQIGRASCRERVSRCV